MELRLRHVGGEVRALPVIGVTGHRVLVRWGLAGIYSYDVRRDVLDGTRGQWRAADVHEAKRVFYTLLKQGAE